MDNSNRALNSGMVNLSAEMEGDISEQLAALERTLEQMNPTAEAGEGAQSPVMQAAADAAQLREQLENLRQQAEARQQSPQAGGVGEMREQLESSRQLAQQLTDNLQQQQGQQQGQRQGQRGQAGQTGQAAQRNRGGFNGGIPEEGEARALGNARSIRSQITRQGLEDFMSQPELLEQLLEPLVELESELRARAELEAVEQRLYALNDEEVPEQYQRLVEAYYRALSDSGADSGGSAEAAQ
jgi:hypothetical protein